MEGQSPRVQLVSAEGGLEQRIQVLADHIHHPKSDVTALQCTTTLLMSPLPIASLPVSVTRPHHTDVNTYKYMFDICRVQEVFV